MPKILFHVPAEWLGGPGLLPFYRRLSEGLTARGVAFDFIPIDRDRLAARVGDGNLHILNHARYPNPRVLSAGVAYVYPFWHLDPQGIRAFSSIRGQVFDAGQVDGEAARIFFRKLRARLVDRRTSRYEQPVVAETVPEGCIAVFLQSEGHRSVEETLWLDRREMLRACLATGRRVVVKPHPLDRDEETFALLAALQGEFANLQISFANIHDILAAAERVVTINSAVGIEAYLHRKPVILCGQADFQHIAAEARDGDELRRLLAAPPPAAPYAKYLHWYFAQNCLNAGAPDLVDRFLERVAAL